MSTSRDLVRVITPWWAFMNRVGIRRAWSKKALAHPIGFLAINGEDGDVHLVRTGESDYRCRSHRRRVTHAPIGLCSDWPRTDPSTNRVCMSVVGICLSVDSITECSISCRVYLYLWIRGTDRVSYIQSKRLQYKINDILSEQLITSGVNDECALDNKSFHFRSFVFIRGNVSIDAMQSVSSLRCLPYEMNDILAAIRGSPLWLRNENEYEWKKMTTELDYLLSLVIDT